MDMSWWPVLWQHHLSYHHVNLFSTEENSLEIQDLQREFTRTLVKHESPRARSGRNVHGDGV